MRTKRNRVLSTFTVRENSRPRNVNVRVLIRINQCLIGRIFLIGRQASVRFIPVIMFLVLVCVVWSSVNESIDPWWPYIYVYSNKKEACGGKD